MPGSLKTWLPLLAALLAHGSWGVASAERSPANERTPPTPGPSPAWFDVAEMARTVEPRIENGEPIWEYDLVVSEEILYLADGQPYRVWAFGGSVPGPMLLAREGERIRIRLINETSNSHTIHSHGLYLPHRMDGVPHAHAHEAAAETLAAYDAAVGAGSAVDGSGPAGAGPGGHRAAPADGSPMAMPPWARPVAPGESFVYDFIAKPAGTHFYHCHMNTNEHLDRGMSGPLIVLPSVADPPVDVDVAVVLDEWDSQFAQAGVPGDPRKRGEYDYFTLNGRSFPHTVPLRLGLGGVARVRLIHAGAVEHFMHLHGQHFLVVDRDGAPLAEPLVLDTVAIGPGQRVDLLIHGNNPGAWPFHDHITAHVTNAGRYPGGMLTRVQVGDQALPPGLEAPAASGLGSLRRTWKARAAARMDRAEGILEGRR